MLAQAKPSSGSQSFGSFPSQGSTTKQLCDLQVVKSGYESNMQMQEGIFF